MMNLTAGTVLIASLAQAETVAVPSGQEITYYDTIQDRPGVAGLTYRFRFIAPAISRDGGTVGVEVAAEDMDFLCETFALPRLPVSGPTPSQVIISLSDRPVEFGIPTPEVTQFFEAYRIEDGICIWEGF